MSQSSVSWRLEDFGANITLTLFNTSRCIVDAIQGVAPSKCVDVSVTADWLAQRASLSFWPWLLSLPWSVEENATSAIPASPLAAVASASASAGVDEQPHTVEEESTALENLAGLFLMIALFFVFFGLITAAADPFGWGYYYDERPRGRARDGSRYVLVEVKDKLEPPPAKA